jgi:CheY-like chemotaxis protein
VSVLVVDDDADIRETILVILQRHGYQADVASDGQEAIERLRGEASLPGLILLDLMMPRMGGAEFRMVQKVDPKLRHLPVVLLSADARMEERARELEVHGAIRKPIDLDELLAVIERYRSSTSGPISRTTA